MRSAVAKKSAAGNQLDITAVRLEAKDGHHAAFRIEEPVMGLMDFIKKQFIDILQWTESGDGVLAWRFPMAEMEIQYGASLTVRESQMAVFVNEGKAADLFGPGRDKDCFYVFDCCENLEFFGGAYGLSGRALADRIGARISVESVPGEGSVKPA